LAGTRLWPGMGAAPARRAGRGAGQRREPFFIKREEMLHPGAVAIKALTAVEPVDGPVERAMGVAQVLRHQVGVIEVGERGARMGRAGIQHRLASGSSGDRSASGRGKVM
jgi:hypothetical protein